MEKIKIAIIGAGSSYTPELIEGIIKKNVLPVGEIALVDIEMGKKKLDILFSLTQRMLKKAQVDIKVTASLNRREVLPGCSYVITQIRVGGLDARALDERIPLKYDTIGQETTGPGGFAKALRTIPVILDIAHDMEELCPDAFLINFTNPSGMVTEAVHQHSRIKCIGLCNVPINMERGIAQHVGVAPEELYCEFAGLNHLSWIKKVFVKGRDMTEELLSQPVFQESIVKNISDVPGMGEISRKIGLIPSPYLGYYYFEKERLKEEVEDLNNEGGTRADQVKKIEKELFDVYANPSLSEKPAQLSERGGALYSEVAISLIESIHNNLGRVHVANVLNRGAVPGLPDDCIIETNCLVNSSGARAIASGGLPDKVMPLVQAVKAYERYAIKAAVSGSRDYAFLALLNHPLVHGADLAEALIEDILEAHQNDLPNFHKESQL